MDDEDPILKRDYNIAVGEDLFDKSSLPSVLRKRRGNFGKKGQSKYTHLTDQVIFQASFKIYALFHIIQIIISYYLYRIQLISTQHGNPMTLFVKKCMLGWPV